MPFSVSHRPLSDGIPRRELEQNFRDIENKFRRGVLREEIEEGSRVLGERVDVLPEVVFFSVFHYGTFHNVSFPNVYHFDASGDTWAVRGCRFYISDLFETGQTMQLYSAEPITTHRFLSPTVLTDFNVSLPPRPTEEGARRDFMIDIALPEAVIEYDSNLLFSMDTMEDVPMDENESRTAVYSFRLTR